MRRYSVIGFFIILALYSLFQARFLILGPQISIDSPEQNSLVDPGVITATGKAKNVSFLTLNGRPIYTDTKGLWEEKLIAHVGPNIIKLEAKDRYGREKVVEVQVVANK